MKKIYLLLLLLQQITFSYGQSKNLTLLSNYTFPGRTCAGVWHFNDESGHEYALVGTSNGLTILDITNPASPQHIFDVPDTPGLWREVKVWSHYAYVSNEGVPGNGGGGITIVDLSTLPSAPAYKKYTGDGAIAGKISMGHTVQAVDGYLYINGCNDLYININATDSVNNNQGTLICSLADPWNPHFVGAYNAAYVHDCFVRGDTLITSEIYHPSHFTISNISDKANPVVLKSNTTPSDFNHNTWMSDDDHYLFTTDEKSRAPLGAYDISNLNNIQLVDTYRPTLNPVGEVHNVRVLDDFLVNACYGDSVYTGSQVTIVDAARPFNLIEVGYYVLCPPNPYFIISWDADPFLPSGNLIATEGLHGLFVFAPTYRRACYVEGNVKDCSTGGPLNNVKVKILTTIAFDSTKFTGNYKTGVADSGVYNVVFSKAGYVSDTVNVVLKNGVLTTLNAQLCVGTTGINEINPAANLLNVYPNPASHDLTINIDPSLLNAGHHLRLVLTDALGRKVRELAEINLSTISLTREGIADGCYNLQLIDESTRIADAVVIFQ